MLEEGDKAKLRDKITVLQEDTDRQGLQQRTLRLTVFTKALDLKNPHPNDEFITSKFLNVRCCQHTTTAVTTQDVVGWPVQLYGSSVGFQPCQDHAGVSS